FASAVVENDACLDAFVPRRNLYGRWLKFHCRDAALAPRGAVEPCDRQQQDGKANLHSCLWAGRISLFLVSNHSIEGKTLLSPGNGPDLVQTTRDRSFPSCETAFCPTL